MASCRRSGVGFGLLVVLLATSRGHAIDIGIVPSKLFIIDSGLPDGTAKVMFRSKDLAISNGRAADVERVSVRLHLQYGDGATAAAFMVPAGTANGWSRNDSGMLRFHNRDAPGGATETRSIGVRPHRLLKFVGAGRGDTPLDLTAAGAPLGGIYVSFEMVEAGVTTRLCAQAQTCEYQSFGEGAGAKLRCMGGLADPGCRAAYPVYVSGTDARYDGAGTLAVIGDSITVQSTDALQEALAPQWYAHVRARGGSMFREMQPAAERIGESRPQVVVINLGTNDGGCALRNTLLPDDRCRYPDFTLQDEFDDARAMVASLPGACVIGTTTWFGPIGDLWWDMLATGEIAGVVPWQEHLTSLSSEERQLLLADGLGHLTAAGTVALAQMTAGVVAQACGASS